ncbi:tyrosine-type recombinase/integrase [Kribbella sp. NPDC023855]|uniref:tyrosine-type recombinase/integrase n=1 Tax=Kribbella sp. NPDC023855 TaxID=3154698 RepID=UPI0033FB8540
MVLPFPGNEREIASLVLAHSARVVQGAGVAPWVVVDVDGVVVVPIERFLRDFVARGNSAGSVRSYAFVLQRWWRFLDTVGVPWDRATAAEARDLVLWMMQAVKPAPGRSDERRGGRGGVNQVTGKAYLDERYKPRTIRHNNAVLRSFYAYWIDRGDGPLLNPVPRDGRGRPNAHHNPLLPFAPIGRLRYNPKVPKRAPRAMPDERWNDLFGSLISDRDRAILALAVSTAARAGELLGLRVCDVDWGDQLIRVRRKGSGAEQWLPASTEAFVWLRLYLDQVGLLSAGDVLWWTMRRRSDGRGHLVRKPLTYDALRAVLRRANASLGTNWSMHDLRHTCALRMVRDARLSLRDVQVILGHAHLTTTQLYLVEDDAAVIRRVHEYLKDTGRRRADVPVADGYGLADLNVLFGGAQ